MKTNDLTIANLSNEHESMANVFYKAIKYAYPDLKNLIVTYDGKRIDFDFDGDIIIKNKVLATANDLINSVTDKPKMKLDFDIASILNNANEVMKSVHWDDWRDKVKDIPYVYTYTPPAGQVYKCSYRYSGQETEGAVYTYPDFYCRGLTPAHALHKYQFFLTLNGMMKATETLEQYLKHDYAGGGWGFFTEEATYNCNFFSDTIYPNWDKVYNDGK